MRNALVEVPKKNFFFTDDIEIFGLSGIRDNVRDDTISKSFCRHAITRRVCQHYVCIIEGRNMNRDERKRYE